MADTEVESRRRRYLADTVLFAAELFCAGTAGKFEQPRVRLLSAGFGVANFAFAIARTLLQPIA